MAWGQPAGKGGASAWADAVDDEEQAGGVLGPSLAGPPADEFPTLGQAKQAGQGGAGGKKEKKKGTKMSFSDFVTTTGGVTSRGGPKHEKEILMMLPTSSSGDGPVTRDPGALGGAFNQFGGERGDRGGRIPLPHINIFLAAAPRSLTRTPFCCATGAGYGRRTDDSDGPRRSMREDDGPSRADSTADWGTVKKFEPSAPSSRGGFGAGGGGGGFRSREASDMAPLRSGPGADEVDDWGKGKKFEPSSTGGPERRGGLGGGFGGFRDGPRDGPALERREPRMDMGPSRADQEDQWSRRGPLQPPADAPGDRERDRFGAGASGKADEADVWVRKGGSSDEAKGGARDAAGGGGRPERPKLNLKPRTAPLPDQATDQAALAESTKAAAEGAKANPFGAARPREAVLKEKGIDYVKEELKLQHGEVQRKETAEEKVRCLGAAALAAPAHG